MNLPSEESGAESHSRESRESCSIPGAVTKAGVWFPSPKFSPSGKDVMSASEESGASGIKLTSESKLSGLGRISLSLDSSLSKVESGLVKSKGKVLLTVDSSAEGRSAEKVLSWNKTITSITGVALAAHTGWIYEGVLTRSKIWYFCLCEEVVQNSRRRICKHNLC